MSSSCCRRSAGAAGLEGRVVFLGDPGTETGEHYDGEGTFKIPATPRVAPPKHNRRSSDRAGTDGQFNRRARGREPGDREQTPDPARRS